MIKNKKGITLIALVVTIIVLLILAGISIAMLVGENGIITTAITVNRTTRGGEVNERVRLEVSNNKILEVKGKTLKTKEEVIQELAAEGKLTTEEVALLTDSTNPTNIITIGGIVIDFSNLPSEQVLTIGSVYTDAMIGQTFTYSANGCYKWIVFGPELDSEGNKTGNILLTSSEPIASQYYLNENAKTWLYYDKKSGETGYNETDGNSNSLSLNKVCSIYGGTLQEKTINSRSITLKDINYVTGYTETNFDTYTFGTESDFENNKVDYLYPSILGAGRADTISEYFVKAGETLNGEVVPEQDFASNNYNYNASEASLTKASNMKYVIGDSGTYSYMVASRSAMITSSEATFYVAGVNEGTVNSGLNTMCSYIAPPPGFPGSGMASDNEEDAGNKAVRPIVVIPGSIRVEEVTEGVYDIEGWQSIRESWINNS